jgi:multimeric flavodoxin WrbA
MRSPSLSQTLLLKPALRAEATGGIGAIRVLGISGSPRENGNTAAAVRECLKAAESEGATTSYISLATKRIESCDGCRSCAGTGECRMKDDFMEVFDAMREADAVVLASPSYFEAVTPVMKALIDRAGYYNINAHGRLCFAGKVGGAIAIGRRTGHELVWSQMILFLTSQRMTIPGIAGFPNVIAQELGDFERDSEGVQKVRELGRALVSTAKRLHETP